MLQWEHSAILTTFIKLPFVIKIFVFSIFEWLFYTGFTVCGILSGCSLFAKIKHLGVTSIQRVKDQLDIKHFLYVSIITVRRAHTYIYMPGVVPFKHIHGI